MEEPIAAAIGSGVDITKPFGNLIVDIGGGTTDVAVISLGGVVVSSTIKVAGDTFDQEIMSYIRQAHGLFIGEDTAEMIKVRIGTAIEEANPRVMEVKGRNILTGLPKTIKLTSEEIRVALKDAINQSQRRFTVFWKKHLRNSRQILWIVELFLPAAEQC